MSDTALNKIIQYGTTAERAAFTPAPAASSKVLYIWFDTDASPNVYIWNGSAWVQINAVVYPPPFTAPINGDFSWVNQDTATVTTTDGGVYLAVPASLDTDLHLRVKSSPSPPYTITALFIPDIPRIDFAQCGIGWRDSGTGKLVMLNVVNSSGLTVEVSKWTNETTFSATYTQSPSYTTWFGSAQSQSPPALIGFQISDDNTNRICRISSDGVHFHQIHSVGRTDFMTPNQVVFGVKADASFTQATGMWLLSWKQT